MQSGVQFSELSCQFTKVPGRMAVHDGVLRGPAVGATIEGQIDYVRDDVHLQGTFVPLYGLNNMFGQIPILGIFLGGGNKEGLLGITYDAVGPPNAPRITVNPVSAIAPGLLRKFFPSPGSSTAISSRRRAKPLQIGLISTCFLRPSESLITPSGVEVSQPRASSSRR